MDEIEKLKKQYDKLRQEIQRAEQREFIDEMRPKMLKLVGTFWKYRNCYSCSDKPSDYWWAYRRVHGVRANGFVITEVQIDKYGTLTVNPKQYIHSNDGTMSGWIRASKREWDKNLSRAGKLLR
jgi:hypothetical protein